MSQSPPEAITDLLISRAISGLDRDQEDMLEAHFRHTGTGDDWSFDRTVASIDVALARGEGGDLPRSLKQKVLASGCELVRDQSTARPAAMARRSAAPDRSSGHRREWIAWLACAASLLIATSAFWFSRPVDRPMTLEQLAAQPDSTRLTLASGGDATAESLEFAEVVWSDRQQQGYLSWQGLQVNDPQTECYQLWVIDRERGFEQRVDGGRFHVSGEDGIVHFRAKLPVTAAEGFAVTRESPGGVVVSDLQRVVLLGTRASEPRTN